MNRVLLACLLIGCAAPAEEAPAPAEHLPLPDLSDVDWALAFEHGVRQLLSIDTAGAWAAHAEALTLRQPGCPDLWASAPDGTADLDADLGWADLCRADGLDWTGFLFWDGSLAAAGADTIVGQRRLVGDARIADLDGVPRFAFTGEAEGAFTRTPNSWSRSSTVAATAHGSAAAPLGASAVTAWRADLYLFVTSGGFLEARGEAWLPDDVVAGRFDSVAADLQFGDADPDGCPLEPRGWTGLRDASAYWYELVFQPLGGDAGDPLPNAPLDACDGCGTLYARGVEQGTVCLDVADLVAAVPGPPDPADYLLTLRDLVATEE